jgi:hypothetical protein
MPSYLDFDSTKKFRDYILGKTLQQPNGPQTFTSNTYGIQSLSEFSDKSLGNVDTNRTTDLSVPQTSNIYKPEEYFIKENLENLPRRANLDLYPYFVSGDYTLLSIVNANNFDTESELFKFAAKFIKNDPNGPVYSRIAQNVEKNTLGKDRLLDALNGNTNTAINILTGKEPLIESNYSITVDNTLSVPGLITDFLSLTTGIEYPVSIIPGDVLTNPLNVDNNPRPIPSSEGGKLWQDVTGALGSLIGIQRRPTNTRKPSDILVEYMGQGQRNRLFDLLSYSKYAPNYTTTARSQNTSKLFTFADNVAQGGKSLLGIEAPAGVAYIGDDRGNDVYHAMNDFYDRPVRSSYYLSFMFDETAAVLFHDKTKNKPISDGGPLSGELTWVSTNMINKIGEKNTYAPNELSKLQDSLSTKYGFRQDSILGHTQEILNSMPSNGGEARSHVANVIDQTSRMFIDGGVKISRGNAVKYVSKYSGTELGVEYGRVWTKDRSYYSLGDTMPLNDDEVNSKTYTKTNKPYRRGNIRQYNASVLDNTWNINMYPVSNGNKTFDGSTNIVERNPGQGDFYAKKYMLSIENLAWKTSNRSGYTVNDLPACERGPNGGRIMWFPPYDLKVNETNSAQWEDNKFIGRPEPIYTYSYTQRSATVSFKVVVDHPSILNLLVRDHFKNMTDEEADNYINAYFAGIKDIDFYSLIQTYATLDKNDLDLITAYLNSGVTTKEITTNLYTSTPVVTENKSNTSGPTANATGGNFSLYFDNAIPLAGSNEFDTTLLFSDAATTYISNISNVISNMTQYVNDAVTNNTPDKAILLNNSASTDTTQIISNVTKTLNGFSTTKTAYDSKISEIKDALNSNNVKDIKIDIQSSASSLGKTYANYTLSIRRTFSVLKDMLKKLSKNNDFTYTIPQDLIKAFKSNWTNKANFNTPLVRTIKVSDLGYQNPDPNINPTITFSLSSVGELGTSIPNSPSCTKEYTTNNLQIYGPSSIYCRYSRADITYNLIENTSTNNPINSTSSIINVKPVTKTIQTGNLPKPSIDVMKRIIMKTLSECHYFQKMEETTPVVFKSLKEKLKFFHPGFHSTTPEGLNSRLTFLLQCVRPGDTMPIKGINEASDLPARNTTFGPPPICVLRIGDFYNSKVVIRDININYDESPWDLNPEGIGIQPMIANVTLQLSLIGGQGLETPVNKLQNALSSNFFANTEMYDERSESSLVNSLLGGKNANDFTKEFLEKIQKTPFNKLPNYVKTPAKPTEGVTIGKKVTIDGVDGLDYTYLVDRTYTYFTDYYATFVNATNMLYQKYGKIISTLYLDPTYRKINSYSVYTSTTPVSLTFVGELDPTSNFTYEDAIIAFKAAIETSIRTNKPSAIFGYTNLLGNTTSYADNLMIETMVKLVNDKIDTINQTVKKVLEPLISGRNKIIDTLDRLNYITHNYLYDTNSGTAQDGAIISLEKKQYTQYLISGFTKADFVAEYIEPINYFKNNALFPLNLFDNSVDFTNPVINLATLNKILPYLVLDIDEKTMFADFDNQKVVDVDFQSQMKVFYNDYKLYAQMQPNLGWGSEYKAPQHTSEVKLQYGILDMVPLTDTNVQTELQQVLSAKNTLGTTLNLYNHS